MKTFLENILILLAVFTFFFLCGAFILSNEPDMWWKMGLLTTAWPTFVTINILYEPSLDKDPYGGWY